MKKLILTLLIFVSAISGQVRAKADVVLVNGRIWTASPDRLFVSAIALSGNKIAAVGNRQSIQKLIGKNTRVIDMGGRFIMPGINDSHIHFLGASLVSTRVDLTEAKSVADAQRIVADYANANSDVKWITGSGWQYTIFPDGGLPTKEMLDKVVSDRPVFIRSYDGHSGWANSKALQMAGVDRNTQFSGFGEIVRDSRSEPTGVFKEGAMQLVARLIPPIPRDAELAALRSGMKTAASLGITSIQNASGSLREAELYDSLRQDGDLSLRVRMAFSLGPASNQSSIDEASAASRRFSSPMLKVGAVKLLVDGVIESHTAAMLKPYSNKDSTGTPNFDQKKLNELVAAADKAGLQVYVHAIGDAGVRMTLDAYENAVKLNSRKDSRFRIEHIETIDPADIPRFKRFDVIASMEPIHADPGTISVWSEAIGPERASRGFAWKALSDAGARLIFSSDYPAAISMSPWRGLHNAVNRQTIDGTPVGGWQPQHRVSVQGALEAYTSNGAFASFEERSKGRIEPGMLADIIVLDRDPFKIPPSDIYKINVLITIFDGKIIYERAELSNSK